MTATTAPLPGDYHTPVLFLQALLETAYGHSVYAWIDADEDAQQLAARPDGVRQAVIAILGDPTARLDDWHRNALRQYANGGE